MIASGDPLCRYPTQGLIPQRPSARSRICHMCTREGVCVCGGGGNANRCPRQIDTHHLGSSKEVVIGKGGGGCTGRAVAKGHGEGKDIYSPKSLAQQLRAEHRYRRGEVPRNN